MIKKLALTALASVSFAGIALADSHPTVTVGGHLDAYWGFVDERDEFRYEYPDEGGYGSRRRDHALVNETKVIVRADGKLDRYDIKYGGLIYLFADTSVNHYGNDDYYSSGNEGKAEQTMAYFEGRFGRLEGGSYTGASHALHVSATQIARGHSGIDGGGIDSDWWKWINPNSTADYPVATQYILIPQLYTNNIGLMGIEGVNASKLTYFTPAYRGFQGGVSYIPDLESYGTVYEAMEIFKHESYDKGGLYRDILEGGVRYTGMFKGVGVKAGLVGQFGSPKAYDGESFYVYHRLQAWELGIAARYLNWMVAGAFADLRKSGQLEEENGTNSRYWNIGIAYEHGPFGASVTYAASNGRLDISAGAPPQEEIETKTRVRTFAVGADWVVTKGIKLYGDVVHFSLKVPASGQNPLIGNRGTTARIGSLLYF